MAPSATVIDYGYEPAYTNQESLNVSKCQKHGGQASKDLVKGVLKGRAQNVDINVCEPGEEDAFFVADMGEVYRQHLRWKINLKRVKPHYGESSSQVSFGNIF